MAYICAEPPHSHFSVIAAHSIEHSKAKGNGSPIQLRLLYFRAARELLMFGMLDYRAYKLFWLIGLPFRIAVRLVFFITIAIAIIIGNWTGYPPLARIVIAYVTFEALFLIVTFLWMFLIAMPLEKVLFWIIDVIPSRGANQEEAREVVRHGPVAWLGKKFMNDIENWSIEDTEEFAKQLNWRSRLLFKGREKVWKRADVLREAYWQTGKQPAELGNAEMNKLLKPYKDNWLETVIISPHGFNSILAASIIILTNMYIAQHH